jgi:hypothetical protein
MVTFCVDRIPIALAAPEDRSSVTPGVNGPRSFTLTVTFLPVLGFPTSKQVPKANDLCAAVIPPGLNTSPEAVRCPRCSLPYQVARTTWSAKEAVVKHVNSNAIGTTNLIVISHLIAGKEGKRRRSQSAALQRGAKLRKNETTNGLANGQRWAIWRPMEPA